MAGLATELDSVSSIKTHCVLIVRFGIAAEHEAEAHDGKEEHLSWPDI